MGSNFYYKDTPKKEKAHMGNSSSATKLAIARLNGSRLPIFVPSSVSQDVATLVRQCILQADNSRKLKVANEVYKKLAEHLSLYEEPRYTISQYLLILLCTVSTTSELIDRHDRGLISDKEFIKQIKNDKNNNGAKVSSKVGRKKGKSNASDRTVLPSEIHEGANSKVS